MTVRAVAGGVGEGWLLAWQGVSACRRTGWLCGGKDGVQMGSRWGLEVVARSQRAWEHSVAWFQEGRVSDVFGNVGGYRQRGFRSTASIDARQEGYRIDL